MILLLFVVLSLQAPQKDDSARNRQQPAAAYQRGSDSLPVSVKLLNTGENEAAAEQNAERIQEERANARSSLFITGALVIATMLSLVVLGYQSYWLKRSVTHAEKATRIELRAYIMVSGVTIRAEAGRVTLINGGKTPAYRVRGGLHVYHGPRSWWRPETEGKIEEAPVTLAPGGDFFREFSPPLLTAKDEAQIAIGDTAMIGIHGHIAYTDVFGVPCTTEYCYDVDVAKIGTNINLTDGHNEAT